MSFLYLNTRYRRWKTTNLWPKMCKQVTSLAGLRRQRAALNNSSWMINYFWGFAVLVCFLFERLLFLSYLRFAFANKDRELLDFAYLYIYSGANNYTDLRVLHRWCSQIGRLCNDLGGCINSGALRFPFPPQFCLSASTSRKVMRRL